MSPITFLVVVAVGTVALLFLLFMGAPARQGDAFTAKDNLICAGLAFAFAVFMTCFIVGAAEIGSTIFHAVRGEPASASSTLEKK